MKEEVSAEKQGSDVVVTTVGKNGRRETETYPEHLAVYELAKKVNSNKAQVYLSMLAQTGSIVGYIYCSTLVPRETAVTSPAITAGLALATIAYVTSQVLFFNGWGKFDRSTEKLKKVKNLFPARRRANN